MKHLIPSYDISLQVVAQGGPPKTVRLPSLLLVTRHGSQLHTIVTEHHAGAEGKASSPPINLHNARRRRVAD